jgi:hippurate hydrolase
VTVDPVLLAASVITRLQGLVAREISPSDRGVVTVSRLRAGQAENVIPDDATITLNFRAFDPAVAERLTAGARRIIDGEAAVSAAPRPPSYRTLSAFPVTVNDLELTASLASVLPGATEIAPMMGSEDFGLLGTAAGAPSVFWGVAGSHDGGPSNHSPQFAPSVDPTLETGVAAMITAARHVLASD